MSTFKALDANGTVIHWHQCLRLWEKARPPMAGIAVTSPMVLFEHVVQVLYACYWPASSAKPAAPGWCATGNPISAGYRAHAAPAARSVAHAPAACYRRSPPGQCRKVDRTGVVLTNNMTLPPLIIAAPYKRCWQGELFFDSLSYCTPSYVIEYPGSTGLSQETTGFSSPWRPGTRRGRLGVWSTVHCGRLALLSGVSGGSDVARRAAQPS
jgi:hypothetical protein